MSFMISGTNHVKLPALVVFAVVLINYCHPRDVSAQSVAEQAESLSFGATLYDSLRCSGCHNVAAKGINIPPSLEHAGSRFQPQWIESYLKNPYRRRWERAGVRPILRMPDFQLSDDEAQALAGFLSSRQDTALFNNFSFALNRIDTAMIDEGKEIYHEYACYGCHEIAGSGGKVGPDLTHVGSRVRPEYLTVFLKDPQALIPGSPMKNFGFWDEELAALVAYLMSLR